ncbi:MAG: type IV pili twitching motility protein PilT [Planctomycetota bacterium]|nr:MAG: type IV pili twitching motility protein PilT [Planctomycetota bacterium]
MTTPELHKILSQMQKLNSSDLHLKAGSPPIFRVNGEIKRSNGNPFTSDDIKKLVDECLNEGQIKKYAERHDIDFAVEVEDIGRFRVNAFKQRGLCSVVARFIKNEIPQTKDLLLPPSVDKISSFTEGLVLVTGITGSGKSTTLTSIVDQINRAKACHIITIEDPIEYVHKDQKAIVNQRELGQDTETFLGAIKYALRQDPDVILVGELRDKDTVETALQAAETGHLVLSTIHSATVSQTISRILDFFPAERHDQIRTLLIHNLRSIISQRLLKGINKKFPRVPAVEVMFNTPPVKKAIEEKNDAHIEEIMYEDKEEGMQTFNQSLISLFKQKYITSEEALARSPNPEALKMNLSGIFIKNG